MRHNRHNEPGWVEGVDIPDGWGHDAPICIACGHDLSLAEQIHGRGYCMDCFDVCQTCFEIKAATDGRYNDHIFECSDCRKNPNE